MARRLMLLFGVLALASCSNVCGSTSPVPVSSPSPQASSPGASPTGLVADPSCKSEPSSHSLNSNSPTSFTITNHSSVTLTLFWLNFTGQRVKYFDLPPGGTKTQATFITHPWIVADPSGTCLRLFLVTDPIQFTVG
jgi:hypothetical protein